MKPDSWSKSAYTWLAFLSSTVIFHMFIGGVIAAMVTHFVWPVIGRAPFEGVGWYFREVLLWALVAWAGVLVGGALIASAVECLVRVKKGLR